TLIGFSLNDTIVVFDRIRETADKYKKEGFSFVINKSINDMIGRTLITSGTVLVSALCLFFFAGGVVEDIAFVLTVGVLFGVYSSIYVAAPVILIVNKLQGKPA
ncbi:MAG: protein translocase subunit SecF, partial [Bdellovibrionaceae bacterium]|nr:protein translocase subunit SecF [Pseudobdellovibrionaceae bacterium]